MHNEMVAKLKQNQELFDKAYTGIDAKVGATLARMRSLPWGSDIVKPYIGTSGGKDSVVIMWLTDQVFTSPKLPVIHTPKRETHPDTVNFLYDMSRDRTILFCTKEDHKDLDYDTQIDGTRIAEYNRTDGRSTHLVQDGKEVSRLEMDMWWPNGLFGLNFVYPIFDWSDEDVWACILKNEIPFTQEYLNL